MVCWIGNTRVRVHERRAALIGMTASGRACDADVEGGIARIQTHMLFQGMFFIITPALICGAFAERMKFSAMVVYSILWGTVHLLSAVPLGLGRRFAGIQRDQSGRRGDRLCWRHGRAHQQWRVGTGRGDRDWPTLWDS